MENENKDPKVHVNLHNKKLSFYQDACVYTRSYVLTALNFKKLDDYGRESLVTVVSHMTTSMKGIQYFHSGLFL